jgi:hypothetical protein
MAQAVEHLPRKHSELSTPVLPKKGRRRRQRRRKKERKKEKKKKRNKENKNKKRKLYSWVCGGTHCNLST